MPRDLARFHFARRARRASHRLDHFVACSAARAEHFDLSPSSHVDFSRIGVLAFVGYSFELTPKSRQRLHKVVFKGRRVPGACPRPGREPARVLLGSRVPVGFRPATPIEEGIRRFVAWYRDHTAGELRQGA
jgi:hypothetical protein